MRWLLKGAMAISVALACVVTTACVLLLAPFALVSWYYRRAR